ncbi:LIM domain only protein 7-like isoform X3 [Gouania willdenowi]|uniref:LIM domain only protein 7-like isoform X3 n=1 Tax=Gouania willdenowi TaxID=441366 RepID=UPI001054DCBD|nr:LIM domain only protein 7-like isoform X3 [Gouania willdenowi]
MEWRQQTSVSCAHAFIEARRWIEQVTGKSFGCKDFRAALENGVLLCDLINQLRPGVIKRVNRLSTPIAGLDNVSVFLKGCEKLGLNESQLFHPGDLQDPSTRVAFRRDESSRRLKNVLITIYWLGRKAQLDSLYNGPPLDFKAFEGLLGLALSKVLDDGSNVLVRDSQSKEYNSLEREESLHSSLGYKRENSVDSIDSLDSRTVQPSSEGCGSDTEAEQVFRMESMRSSLNHIKGVTKPQLLLQRQQGKEHGGNTCGSPLSSTNLVKVRHERTGQVNPGWIWSKSLSDIPMVYPARKVSNELPNPYEGQEVELARAWIQESIGKCTVTAKDSEVKWQDDFTKWKNRRRSTKPDLFIKSQDREHVINQMSNGAAMNYEKNKAHSKLYKRDLQSPRKDGPAPRIHSTSPTKSFCFEPKPQTRVPLSRSYATESSFSKTAAFGSCNSIDFQVSPIGAMFKPERSVLVVENHFSSLASDPTGVSHSLKCLPVSQNHIKVQFCPPAVHAPVQMGQPKSVQTNQISTLFTTIKCNETTKSYMRKNSTPLLTSQEQSRVSGDLKVQTLVLDSSNQSGPNALQDSLHQIHIKSQEKSQMVPCDPVMERTTSQQQANVQKYLTRAGSWSGSAGLPRGFRRSLASSRLSAAITARPFGTNQSRVSSLPRMCNVDDDDQGSFLIGEKVESSTTNSSFKKQTSSNYPHSQHQPSVRQRKANQARQTFARQGKEVNGASYFRSASLQTSSNSHQSFVQNHLMPQPFSSQQLCHSESLSLPSTASSEFHKVDHSDMRVSLTLQPNNVPDFGFHTHWDNTGARVKFILPGSPAEICHLCVDDEIVSVNGVFVAQMNYSQWKDTLVCALETGGLTMDIRRYGNKDWSTNERNEPIQPSQKQMSINLITSARVCPDQPAESAASGEMKRLKVSKCNGSKNDAEVKSGGNSDYARTARSTGGSESAISDLQVPSISSTSPSCWDREEERRRQEKWQEEQERLLQEQYQRDQERLHAEWQKAQQEVMEVRNPEMPFKPASSGESLVINQLCVNGEVEDRAQLKSSEANPQCNAYRTQTNNSPEKDWAVSSCGMTQLSPAHRVKSFSTSVLTDSQQQARADQRKSKGQTMSKAEQDRQRILQEMKKRNQLLTDNSWIRRRSSSLYKEPVYIGIPMKRYESLDNLDTWRGSPITSTSFSYSRPQSAAAGFCAPSRNSCSRYSTGSTLSQKITATESPHQDGMCSTQPVIHHSTED